MPYAPEYPMYGSGRRGGGSTIADILREQGRVQAEGAQRQGDIFANLFSNVGQQLGGAIMQAAEDKKTKAATEALAKQDAAFVARINSGEPMGPRDFVTIYGPDKGMKMAGAYGQLQQPKPDVRLVAAGFDSQSDPMKAMSYPNVRQSLVTAHPELADVMPPEFDLEWWQKMKPQILGEKGGRQLQAANPGQTFFDPNNPQAGAVYTAPSAPEKAPEPRVVGRSLVGQDGKVIYRDPADASNEPLVAIMGADGQSVLVPRSQAAGKRPASNREQGRAVTSGDAGKVAEMDTALDDLNALSGTLKGGPSGTTAYLGSKTPDFLTSWTGLGADAKKKQATIDRVKQVIGKTLEGGVLRKEDEIKYEKILPTISDTDEVAAAKLNGLWSAIQQRRQTHLDALGDAGYDTGRFTARAPREPQGGAKQIKSDADYAALPSGADYIAPDGSLRKKR